MKFDKEVIQSLWPLIAPFIGATQGALIKNESGIYVFFISLAIMGIIFVGRKIYSSDPKNKDKNKQLPNAIKVIKSEKKVIFNSDSLKDNSVLVQITDTIKNLT